MKYETRRRVRLGMSLARQRLVYALTPRRVRRARFFDAAVDWPAACVEPGDGAGLAEFALRRKWEQVAYLVDSADLAWLRTADPFGQQGRDPRTR